MKERLVKKFIQGTYDYLTTLVDDEDEHLLDEHKNWRVGGSGYVVARIKGERNVYLHYLVLQTTKQNGFDVDHINGNKLDNRKENLRIVPHHINLRNNYRRRNKTILHPWSRYNRITSTWKHV